MIKKSIENRFIIIGNGRLAKHLINYFRLLDLSFAHWHRSSGSDLGKLVGDYSHVLLAISDGAIASFYEEHPEIHGKVIVQFSGANSFSFANGAHPLMTFTHNLYALEEYKNIFFMVEKGNLSFAEILPGLPNKSVEIAKEKKPYYHALCVLGGNFSVILWKKMLNEFESRLGISREAMWPYLEKILTEFMRDPQNSLTGPISRGDWKTIEKNLESLKGDNFRSVYEAVLEAQ
jgi:2-dehydropantoate 2-reductase